MKFYLMLCLSAMVFICQAQLPQNDDNSKSLDSQDLVQTRRYFPGYGYGGAGAGAGINAGFNAGINAGIGAGIGGYGYGGAGGGFGYRGPRGRFGNPYNG